MQRDVSSTIVFDVTAPADLVFSVAVSAGAPTTTERFTATADGSPLEVHEIDDVHGARLHRVSAPVGTLEVGYDARVVGAATSPPTTEADLLTYRRPSRYAESDVLAATAAAEFGGIDAPADLLDAVSSWVGTRLSYVPGSSLPTDGASRTLLERRGVCRDYAHLCVALLRAAGLPARLVSVYAPGLDPMDFHAVAEAWVDDAWYVVDATTLAPRQSLVRIATGRDAADTAFVNVLSGRADLVSMQVSAVADRLPVDDVRTRVRIG